MLTDGIINEIITGTIDTLYMTSFSTIFAYLFAFPLGIALVVTKKDGLYPLVSINRVLDFIVNIGRSIPFIILILLVIPITKLIAGKSYGATATIVPLVIAAIPFIARLIESSLQEVDHGVVEAAQSMGASISEIIFKVLIPEAKTSLIVNAVIAAGTIIGYSAMAGAVGGGGLGDIAIRYGYERYKADVMIITVVLLIIIMQLLQIIGTQIAIKTDKRNIR
ncbi:methionine ABC transporter permease [Sedimentibacter sp. MB31-C6]|uniref:methionine ABC transporter permease n=1 Tax=Sedimentibacter sp. MB31-C6 TaxID=3109366 RepID=UPI002DDD9CAF|nr:methionine ABC transporter permease [Sedimentibacter sp. MB36-C1]WSI02974.1 methionine ABC transporter permease [Sedimentibacter sp. MB36-C1]